MYSPRDRVRYEAPNYVIYRGHDNMVAGGDDRNVWSITRTIITDGKRRESEPNLLKRHFVHPEFHKKSYLGLRLEKLASNWL
jgi:hypothetical protein